MRRRGLRLVTELLLVVIGIELIVVDPATAITIEVFAIPILLAAAGLSVLYLSRIYGRQPSPRSRFFGMLVGILTRGWVAMLWIGYLVVGRILERLAEVGIAVPFLPTPPPNVSSPISGLVICLAIVPPIVYAVEIRRIRAAASSLVVGGADLVDLDRGGVV